MKSADLWTVFVRKNPQFEGEGTVTMSRAGLRKLFDTTWDKGHEAGFAKAKAYQSLHEKDKPKPSVFEQRFGSTFK